MSIAELDNIYKKYVENRFHKLSSFLISLILIILFFIFIHPLIKDDFDYEWYVLLLLIVSFIIYWLFFKFKYPKNKKNKIGIVFAIYSENINEEVKLKNDFIRRLEKNIKDENYGKLVNLIVLKNHLSENLKSVKDIDKIRNKIRGHFYLWGDIKKRKDGEEKYFLDLNGYVIHKPLDVYTSKKLKGEFISVLPREISFCENFEFIGFKFTSNIVSLAIKYISGLAAFLSGDPFLAKDLHGSLIKEFDNFNPLPENLKKIKEKLPRILSNENLSIARFYYFNNKREETIKYLDQSFIYNPNNYGYWLLKGTVDFLFDNDPDKSLDTIKIAQEKSNNTCEWRYSKAFLLFYLKRFKEAFDECKKINKQKYYYENKTVIEVEDFTINFLKNKDIPQLYFWLGYLNYKKKNNLPRSLEYFEIFMKKSDQSMEFLKRKVISYLVEIKDQMNIKE